MSHVVRASKYRHVFVEAPRIEDTFQDFRLSTATGEQQYIKGNTKFFCVATQGGGGPMAVVSQGAPGRMDAAQPVIAGHKGAVLDFDFNPFHEHLLASCADDSTIKVWGIPEAGLKENITEPLVDLRGHGRKVTLLRFNPTANNVLASVSADMSVKIWDIEKGTDICSFESDCDLLQDIVWDYTGALCATSSKDKAVRIIDPRSNAIAFMNKEAHEGAKSVKLQFLGQKEKLVSVGFTKQSQRQFKVWDPRKMDVALKKQDIDQAAGVIIPHFDEDTNVLYLAGKGDGNIRYYEFADESPYFFPLSEHRTTVAAKGMCFLPKRGLDVMHCETMRALKLTGVGGKGVVEPLKFVVPRKSDAFQDDLYPNTFSGHASHSADEWLAGSNMAPSLMSLDPNAKGGAPKAAKAAASAPAMKSAMALQKELDEALKRIAVLEAALGAAKLKVPPAV